MFAVNASTRRIREAEHGGRERARVLGFADAPRELVTVHLGHLAIGDHQRMRRAGRAAREKTGERRSAVRHGVRGIAEPRELAHEQPPVRGMVVDHQDELPDRGGRFDGRRA